MTDFHALIHSYQNCACGQAHTCAIRDIEIGSGLVRSVGDILRKNGFGPRLLLAADEQTLAAAEGKPLVQYTYHGARRGGGHRGLARRLYRRAAHLADHPRGDDAGRGEDRELF